MDYIGFTERARSKEWNMIKLESHPYFEVYFLVEGERTIIIKDKVLTVNQPSAIIIPPFTPHRTEGGSYRRINAYISPQLLDEETLAYLHKKAAPLLFVIDESRIEIVHKLLRFGCEIETSKDGNSIEFKKGFFYTVLFYLKQCSTINLEIAPSYYNKVAPKLLDVITYLNEHWNEKISLEFLCNEFFFSKTNLCESFRKVMDCSITDYLLFLRFEKAKEMLFNSNKEVNLIAEECGFYSHNYFSLMFRKRFGLSPSAYRKTR